MKESDESTLDIYYIFFFFFILF